MTQRQSPRASGRRQPSAGAYDQVGSLLNSSKVDIVAVADLRTPLVASIAPNRRRQLAYLLSKSSLTNAVAGSQDLLPGHADQCQVLGRGESCSFVVDVVSAFIEVAVDGDCLGG